MTDWNFAEIWETVAEVLPDAPAVVQGGRRVSYGQLDRRSAGLARWLLDRDTRHQDKVALYLTNCPEYLESVLATTRVGLVPVNTNYRYAERELEYLWDNADAVAVIFHGCFAERAGNVRQKLPQVRSWIWVDDGSGPCPSWATPYQEIVTTEPGDLTTRWSRNGDDLILLYTGGTTGMPKGVMWRQDDLFGRLNASGLRRYPAEGSIDDIRKVLEEQGPGLRLLPACPLMHGTGSFTSFEALAEGGAVVLLTGRHFDPLELWDTVEREQVNVLVIVGDPFARPLLAALDAEPDRWKIDSLVVVISSGAMWSEGVKAGLLRHHDKMLLVDAFSSSEALGMGVSVSSGDEARRTATFTLGPEVKVLAAGSDREVAPGSGEVGVLALGGRNPLGYYKDEAKSAATFRAVGGVRYSIPGDFAEVAEDGTVHVLGRGSVSINTAGEKVFPEEVEEALKTHPGVRDAVVVGIPNERFGEEIVAVVELAATAGDPPTEQELIDQVKGQLASYKAPRRVRIVDTIGRSPSGKADYRRHRDEATIWAGHDDNMS